MAVSDFAPAVVNVIAHRPASTVPVHEREPSVTVTLPLGVPLPGALTVTVYLTVTAWPTSDGSGSSAVIVVVVFALRTSELSAASRFSRRPDTVLPVSPATASPLLISAVFASATVGAGVSENSTAAAPATCGAAIDVPFKYW